jgi:serine/threonine protein kinase
MSQRRACRVAFRVDGHTFLSVRGGAREIFKRLTMFFHVQVVKNLGKGAFGKVKLVQDTKDGKFYALKIMDKMVLKKKRQARPQQELHTLSEAPPLLSNTFLLLLLLACLLACVCVRACVRACVCVCVREREREREI